MQVDELYTLSRWVRKNIEEKQLPQRYQDLHRVLQQNLQPNKEKTPFESQRDTLLSTLRDIHLHPLTLQQQHVLELLDVAPYIGERGALYVEEVLYRNSLDLATAAQKIQEANRVLTEGVQWAKTVGDHMARIVEDADAVIEDTNHDDAIVQITFSGGAGISDLNEFKYWGEHWYHVARGVSMVHDGSPGDLRVIGAGRGSIIFTVATVYGIAHTIAFILERILVITEKVLRIRKMHEELRSLQIANRKAEKQLEADIKEARESGLKEVAEQAVAEVGLQENGQGDKVNALTKAIKELAAFLEKGGEVDCMLPYDREEEDSQEEGAEPGAHLQQRAALRSQFERVRKLEARVKQLEHEMPRNDE